jgi:hypothetical protein
MVAILWAHVDGLGLEATSDRVVPHLRMQPQQPDSISDHICCGGSTQPPHAVTAPRYDCKPIWSRFGPPQGQHHPQSPGLYWLSPHVAISPCGYLPMLPFPRHLHDPQGH